MDAQASDIIEAVSGLSPSMAKSVLYVPARICVACKQKKPSTEAEFAVTKRSLNGTVITLDETCLVCRDYVEEMAHGKVERAAMARIQDAIEKGHAVPHQTDLLGFTYRHIGGPEGAAKKLVHLIEKADAAGDLKVAMRGLDIIYRLQMRVSADQQQLAIQTLPKEDLEVYVNRLEERLIQMTISSPLELGPALEAKEVPGE